MHNRLFAGIAATALLAACATQPSLNQNEQVMKYPETKKGNVSYTHFGTTVQDPYRWLEDDRSADTKAWVAAQNQVTFNYLNQIPFRQQLKDQLTKLWNYERFSAPFVEGDYTYFYKNDGLQQHSVLYRIDKNGKEEVFLDPNKFSKDGTTSLAGVSFTKDGSRAAYSISEGGSDWRKVIIIDTKNKRQIADTLIDVKFSGISWKGNDGFYYSSYDKPVDGSELSGMTDMHKLYYHKLGTPQSTDQLVFGGPQLKRRYIMGYTTEDERFLVVSAANTTTGNELYIKDLNDPNSQFITLVNNFETSTSIVDNVGEKLFIITNHNAPNNKLVSARFDDNNRNNWQVVIPETENVLNISTGGNFLFARYMKDVMSNVKQYNHEGKLIREISLPDLGSAGGFSGKRDQKEIYYSFTNYVTPSSIFKYDVLSGASSLHRKPNIDFDTDAFESKQVFYTSKDGTKVPMLITYKKGLKLDGKNPTMLYGYGGFNVSLTPSFSVGNAIWMNNGGVYAVANLRGGGEYGKKWHDGGRQMQKLNVFDDFIAAAEFLQREGYTSPEYTAISGGSNGGLLVAAAQTRRPDLFKVALPAVGVLDMLRYHTFTAGAGWAYDYGTAEDSREMFNYLKAYSPVHNVRAGVCYPSTLVTTGDHDDRVVPAHSYKFAAELQKHQTCNQPTLIRIETKAGHGAGKPTELIIEEIADKWAFSLYEMGIRQLK
ncbi:MAG: prolyl oligopeptidase family serine peptidase [Weeksellaceae bacterium]|nr:prolyl oligopeptidase family serine peptidase [Weeksellaceae bacterium]